MEINYFYPVGSYKRAHGQCNTSVLEFSHYYYGCGGRFRNLRDFLNAVITIYKVPLPPRPITPRPTLLSKASANSIFDLFKMTLRHGALGVRGSAHGSLLVQ